MAAVDRYLDGIQTTTTRASYAETLAHLIVRAGLRDTASLTPDDYAAVIGRWDTAAPAAWNRYLSALTSFTAWAQRQRDPRHQPRTPAGAPQAGPRRGDRAVPRTRLDKLFNDDRHSLRERVLWRLLYETAARADEILSLNIEDLDLELRRGPRPTPKAAWSNTCTGPPAPPASCPGSCERPARE